MWVFSGKREELVGIVKMSKKNLQEKRTRPATLWNSLKHFNSRKINARNVVGIVIDIAREAQILIDGEPTTPDLQSDSKSTHKTRGET